MVLFFLILLVGARFLPACSFSRLDPAQKNRRGLIVRVLRDELAGKGFLQDRLAQGVKLSKGTCNILFQMVDNCRVDFESPDDFLLFSNRWEEG